MCPQKGHPSLLVIFFMLCDDNVKLCLSAKGTKTAGLEVKKHVLDQAPLYCAKKEKINTPLYIFIPYVIKICQSCGAIT